MLKDSSNNCIGRPKQTTQVYTRMHPFFFRRLVKMTDSVYLLLTVIKQKAQDLTRSWRQHKKCAVSLELRKTFRSAFNSDAFDFQRRTENKHLTLLKVRLI